MTRTNQSISCLGVKLSIEQTVSARAIEAQIKPTFIAHGMEEGVSPARFLYEGGKLKDKCGFSGLV
ncbi:MAG: hypothetical protein ABSE51_23270, partial [Terracidiphilus sp.]